METVENFNIANFLLRNGLGVFPLFSIREGKCTCGRPSCQSPGKHPYFRKNWKKAATCEQEKVKSWFEMGNKYNYAVATGKWSSDSEKFLVVIDVDAPVHQILETLPPTFSYQTGSGGHHFWYWSSFPIANSVSKLAPKVDVRGENGYVVVPPSKHVSGRDYVLHPNSKLEIATLPDFILQALDRKTQEANNRQAKNQSSNRRNKSPSLLEPIDKQEIEKWCTGSVADIRKLLRQGKKIPMGTRNNTIHRLLSSDRAKGLCETKLWERAREYVTMSSLIEEFPISDFELRATITQVLKYEAYNTSFENVNQLFFEFMDRAKSGPMPKAEKERVLLADSHYFEGLQISEKSWCSLQHVSKQRDAFYREREIPKHSKYPLPLLAKKLESLGFSRRRTNKGNLWNVDFSRLNIGLKTVPLCVILKHKNHHDLTLEPLMDNQSHRLENTVAEGNLNMTMNVNDFEQKKISVKINKHPSEPRYCGRVNRDSGDALMKLMAMVSVSDRNEILNGTFVQDEEGTAEEFDAMQPGDRVGVLLSFEDGWTPTQVEIEKVENDTAYGKDLFLEESIDFTFEEVSIARAMGYFEILYRPDATNPEKLIPFGIEREREVTILIPKEVDPNASPPAAAPLPNAPHPVPAPSVNPTPQTPIVSLPMPSVLPTIPSINETPTIDDLTTLMAGSGMTTEQIKAIAEGIGVDIAPAGPAVPARGRGATPATPDSDPSVEGDSST